MQVALEVASTWIENLPGAQGTQEDEDVDSTADEYLPAEQLVQAPFPVDDLYLPAMQLTQVLLIFSKPALQLQND